MSELLGMAYVEVRADSKRLGPDLSSIGNDVKSFFGTLQSQAMSLLPFASVAGAFALVGNEFREGAEAARSQAEADKKLEAVLRATGHAAGLSAEELNHHSAALQNLTGVADDEISNLQSILLTFRNVQGDTFKRATELAVDLSAVLGTDLKGSAMQLGKALNDPVHGIAALTRAGVSFSADQKNVIKSLVETGRVAEAQKMILDELAKEVGGVAAAEAEGPQGQLKLLHAQLGELREELGNKLVPLQLLAAQSQLALTQAISVGLEVVTGAIAGYQQLDAATHGFVSSSLLAGGAVLSLVKLFPYLQATATLAIRGITAAFASSGWGIAVIAVGAIVGGVVSLVNWLSTLVPVQEAWERGTEKLWQAWKHLESTAMDALRSIYGALEPLLSWLGVQWDMTWTGIVDVVGSAVAGMIDFVSSFILDAVEWGVVLIRNWETVWDLLVAGNEYVGSRMIDVFSGAFLLVLRSLETLGDGIWDFFASVPDMIGEALASGDADSAFANWMAGNLEAIGASLKKDLAESLEPSDSSKRAMVRMAEAAGKLYGEKLKVEGERAIRDTKAADEKHFKRLPGGEITADGEKDKSKQVEGFFAPLELAKKLQETMLGKNDKMLGIAEAQKKTQENMLDELKKANERPAVTLEVAGV